MKVSRAVVLASFAACGVARGAIEFVGLMADSRATFFVLRDSESPGRSGWLTIGQSFHGYRVVAFDTKKRTLTLERAGHRIEVTLLGEWNNPDLCAESGPKRVVAQTPK